MLYFLNDYNIAESSIQDEEQLSELYDGMFDENILFCILWNIKKAIDTHIIKIKCSFLIIL